MGTHSTVDAENKIRTSTDVEMMVFGGLGLSSPDTSVFAYHMLNVKRLMVLSRKPENKDSFNVSLRVKGQGTKKK